jgi:hypothetical protein
MFVHEKTGFTWGNSEFDGGALPVGALEVPPYLLYEAPHVAQKAPSVSDTVPHALHNFLTFAPCVQAVFGWCTYGIKVRV